MNEPITGLTTNTGGRKFWLGLVSSLAALIVLGFLIDGTILRVQRQSVANNLNAMLKVCTHAATSWLDDRRNFCDMFTRFGRVKLCMQDILPKAGASPAPAERVSQAERALRQILHNYARAFKLYDGMLARPDGTIVFAEDAALVGQRLPSEAKRWFDRALSGTACMTPMMMMDLGHGKTPCIIVLTPAMAPESEIRGVLALTIHPTDFSNVLTANRPGESGESYAVDVQGRMITESRFLNQMIDAGILPAGTTSTALALDVREPGIDQNGRASMPRLARPFTDPVASLIAGRSGVNVTGFMGYRGVLSVAAWAWLPRYGFGVVVSMAYTEAFAATEVVRRLVFSLMGLLVLASIALAISSAVQKRANRGMREAARKAERLGQYQLERKLGEGGMGEVYLGRHALLRRPTAIKLMRDASKPEDRVRFEQEVRISSRLTHPNTIAIFDYGHTVDGIFYYAMEYLDGLDLATIVTKFGPLPAGRVIHVLVQVCGSLAEAHDMRLVHRDIKPANIMLCARGGVYDTVKVLDFGLVRKLDNTATRLTTAATVMGTPAYMAPEAINGTEVDGRMDLYALGAVAYYLLTGHEAFDRRSLMDTLMAQMQDAPESMQLFRTVPPDLERVIMMTLEKDPNSRPADAHALRTLLLSCAAANEWTDDDAKAWWTEHVKTEEAADSGSLPPLQIAT